MVDFISRLSVYLEQQKMRTINEVFTDAEFDQLKTAKEESGANNWRNFIMMMLIKYKTNRATVKGTINLKL